MPLASRAERPTRVCRVGARAPRSRADVDAGGAAGGWQDGGAEAAPVEDYAEEEEEEEEVFLF